MKVKVQQNNQKTLLEILRETNVYIPAICAGRGTCGKCKVRVLEGEAPVSDADRKFFSDTELQEGFRLSCKLVPEEDLVISMEGLEEENINAVGAGNVKRDMPVPVSYVLGIDIGTTTIAMALADMQTGRVCDEYLTVNRQRMYGADVISRIQASTEGNGKELRKLIQNDLDKGINLLTQKGSIIPAMVVIAANTTMIHILMGYPCETLGVYPFKPYSIEEIESSLKDVIGTSVLGDVPVYILPGISTFVGADIVSDILVSGMAKSTKVSMLIDLGTNGEMVIGNSERMLVASTAAGPAFEGGNIVNGTGSVPGAIYAAEIDANGVRFATIKDKEAVGICGTGVIEVLYELLKNEIVDETGYMEQEKVVIYENDEGEQICFYSKDVRELQLAKAAIRAGVETLLERYGVNADDVDTVYIAGGFGYYVNIEKAIGIGLLPEQFKDKIKVIGNGALKGTISCDYCRHENREAVKKLLKKAAEIELATDTLFSEFYMKYMFFDLT